MSKRKNILCGVVALSLVSCPFIGVNAEEGPETVELDSLARYYDPVEFDHAMHVGMIASDECAICHHHTLGTPVLDPVCLRCHESSGEADTVACRDCHSAKRFSAEYLASLEEDIHLFHVDKPGLKGAFHQLCIECHQKNDAPTGCQDCHGRTDEGDKFFHAGKYAPAPSKHASGHE